MKKTTLKKAVTLTVILALSVLFTAQPETASEAVKRALLLCACSVIPSVFPFIVLSEITVRSGALSAFPQLFRPLGKALGMGESAAGAFVLGNLCGFPVGASTAARLKSRGEITPKEAVRLGATSNNVSTGFAVSFAGLSVIGDKKLGFVLYVCQLLAAVIICVLTRGKDKNASPSAPRETDKKEENIFIVSVSGAAVSTLNIAAFVAIFSVFSSYISALCEHLGVPAAACAFIACLAEISGGCGACAPLSFTPRVLLVAFALGFSGISVLCQSAHFLSKEKISIVPVAAMKLAQGVLTSALALAYLKLFPPAKETAAIAAITYPYGILFPTACLIIISVFLISLALKTHLNKRLDL